VRVKERRPGDFILRFLFDVIGLESLHFGLWDGDRTRTVGALKAAQDNYSRFLMARVPAGAKRVLDAGCGSGELSERLALAGYDVTALTPDAYLADAVTKRLGDRARFALSKFEDHEAAQPYDAIIMSESCQYMSHHLVFPRARKLLAEGGYLLISDYFRKAERAYYETAWTASEFAAKLEKSNFEVVSSEDITDATLPTLEVCKKYYGEMVLPTIELLRDLALSVIPGFVTWPIRVALNKELALAADFLYRKQPEQFDASEFKEHLNYRVVMLRKR